MTVRLTDTASILFRNTNYITAANSRCPYQLCPACANATILVWPYKKTYRPVGGLVADGAGMCRARHPAAGAGDAAPLQCNRRKEQEVSESKRRPLSGPSLFSPVRTRDYRS